MWNINKTWENIKPDNNYGKWVFEGNEFADPVPKVTEQSMMEDILLRTEDEGFFRDILDWLQNMAPKKIRRLLNRLSGEPGKISYESMCESVYQFGFRASEILERRMILGPANKWVRMYFEDFPRSLP